MRALFCFPLAVLALSTVTCGGLAEHEVAFKTTAGLCVPAGHTPKRIVSLTGFRYEGGLAVRGDSVYYAGYPYEPVFRGPDRVNFDHEIRRAPVAGGASEVVITEHVNGFAGLTAYSGGLAYAQWTIDLTAMAHGMAQGVAREFVFRDLGSGTARTVAAPLDRLSGWVLGSFGVLARFDDYADDEARVGHFGILRIDAEGATTDLASGAIGRYGGSTYPLTDGHDVVYAIAEADGTRIEMTSLSSGGPRAVARVREAVRLLALDDTSIFVGVVGDLEELLTVDRKSGALRKVASHAGQHGPIATAPGRVYVGRPPPPAKSYSNGAGEVIVITADGREELVWPGPMVHEIQTDACNVYFVVEDDGIYARSH